MRSAGPTMNSTDSASSAFSFCVSSNLHFVILLTNIYLTAKVRVRRVQYFRTRTRVLPDGLYSGCQKNAADNWWLRKDTLIFLSSKNNGKFNGLYLHIRIKLSSATTSSACAWSSHRNSNACITNKSEGRSFK